MMENEDISDILPLKLFYFSPTYFILLFYGVLNEKKIKKLKTKNS